MGVFYCTREQFQAVGAVTPGLTSNQTIDRLLESKSRGIEESLNRHFYPFAQTRYYDWPSQFGLSAIRLYLNADLLSASSVTINGSTLTPLTSYFLEPINYATDGGEGQFYSRIEIDLSGSTLSFSAGSTYQRAVRVTGLWGYCARTVPSGTLAAALIDTTGVVVLLSDSSQIGVGDLVKVDSEQLLVVEKTLLDTTAILEQAIDVIDSDVTVPVNDGTLLHEGEIVTIDSERILIESISGNNLNVRRAFQGSILAGHSSGAAVYAPRRATVTRGYAGSTASTHLVGAVLNKNVAPQLLTDLCLAEALSTFQQENAAYARTIGSGETIMGVSLRPLTDLRKEVAYKYTRTRGPVAI